MFAVWFDLENWESLSDVTYRRRKETNEILVKTDKNSEAGRMQATSC
jgi:hypothetical protein